MRTGIRNHRSNHIHSETSLDKRRGSTHIGQPTNPENQFENCESTNLLVEHASRDEFNFEHKVEGIVEDEDRELESIFDDLFGDSTSQQTIDEFCNQGKT